MVRTERLTKRYGKAVAVDGLDLSVGRGEVYGFLGPNGAGKTTTLRMLLGLVRPTGGSASVLGLKPGSPDGLRRVGALVESPAFFPYLSGRDNLRGIARLSGITDRKNRVEGALRQVGLERRANDRFKKYSTGMKQRLGVAAALLKDPELLILDEPTNGLDPKGMAEMRALVLTLGRDGRTVLFSSHQMSEVEQACDRVGIVRKGRLVAEGPVSELRGDEDLLLKVDPVEVAAEVAAGIRGVGGIRNESETLRLAVDPGRAHEVVREMVLAGVRVEEVRPGRRSLEDAFFELTEEEVG